MSHYTIEQLRQRRNGRRVEQFAGEVSRLTWERQELREEYARVAAIYTRHLERIKAKAEKNLAAMQQLHDRVTGYAESAGAPAERDSSPAGPSET